MRVTVRMIVMIVFVTMDRCGVTMVVAGMALLVVRMSVRGV